MASLNRLPSEPQPRESEPPVMPAAPAPSPGDQVCSSRQEHDHFQPFSSELGAGSARFTLDGSDDLERHLADTCAEVRSGVQEIIPPGKLEGLLLGGGYGRGEGGVLRTHAGDQPYNDLEFYVFARGHTWMSEWRYGQALRDLGLDLHQAAGVEIEFKIVSAARVRNSPPSMFYYDLLMGHHCLVGNDDLLAGCAHHRDAGNIPLSEGTRLLMNRCSGLLFAREKLQHEPFTADDADFVGRNLAKARLAFGDAILTAFGQYHWSGRERAERIRRIREPESLAWWPEVRRHHAAGIEFKLHPERTAVPHSVLETELAELTALGLQLWLWLEERRLGFRFASARDYALSRVNKCPETNRWRNGLVNLKAFGPAAWWRGNPGRHPRERVLHALTWLLWVKETPNDTLRLRRLESELGVTPGSFAETLASYRSVWQRFN
jgi:hypothetical protein